MKYILRLSFLLLFVLPVLFSQYAYLDVNAPHASKWGAGTVEDATFYINPQGSFCKYDAYLSFSSRGAAVFSSTDSLEVRLNFTLPSGSFVTDLWLWIEGVPTQAMIVDRAKARATYENIVKRIRRDPAILERVYENNYELKIYPLLVEGTRKIKLSYYTLYNPSSNDSLSVDVPIWIVNASSNITDSVDVIVQKNNWRGEPQFAQNVTAEFSEHIDSTYGAVYTSSVLGSSIKSLSKLSVNFKDSLSSHSLFIEKYGNSDSGTYNLRTSPHLNLGLQSNRKILFLIDHDSTISYHSKVDFLNVLKTRLFPLMNSKDSFNVILSSKKGFVVADTNWMSADSSALLTVFSKILSDTVLDSTKLGELLFEGTEYIYDKGKENTSIMVLTSSHEYYTLTKANTYFDTLSKRFAFDIPVYFLNFGSPYSDGYIWSGDRYYPGNFYLYRLIASNSKGSYSEYYYDLPEQITTEMNDMRGYIEYFDLITYLKNGFTYEKINSTSSTLIPVFNYVTQFGKYSGTFPFILQMSAKYRGKTYHETFSIEDSVTFQSDSGLYVYGAYQQIEQYRKEGSQFAKDRIVELSIQNRILSEYTAFLALEPGQKLCDTCNAMNNPVVINLVEENVLPLNYQVIQAYPNPFNPETKLKVRLPHGISNKGVSLNVYNILGQIVKTFDVSNLSDKNFYELRWDGKSDNGNKVSSGVYFAVLTTPQKRHAVKLMLLK